MRRCHDALSVSSMPSLYLHDQSPRSTVPRGKRLGKIVSGRVSRELVHRAFVKSPLPIVASEVDFNTSFRSITTVSVSVECGLGSTPKRKTSSRTVTRGRGTPGCRKASFQKAGLSNLTMFDLSVPRLDHDEDEKTLTRSVKVNDQINTQALKSIAEHKTTLAELRPKRRKVKFTKLLPSEEGDTRALPRIQCLTLQDLSNHGFGNIMLTDSNFVNETTILNTQQGDESPSDGIDVEGTMRNYESNLLQSIRMLERLDELIKDEHELAACIEEENRTLRRELVGCAPLARALLESCSQRHLINIVRAKENELKELDAQIEAIVV